MDGVALGDGDARWVFPSLTDPTPVEERLRGVDAELRGLAADLGVPGDGLAYVRSPVGFAPAQLFGRVTAGSVLFEAGLWFPRRGGLDLRPGPPWEVHGEIWVECPRCGPYLVERNDDPWYDEPLPASQALLDATRWVRGLAASVPLTYWPRRVHCGHLG